MFCRISKREELLVWISKIYCNYDSVIIVMVDQLANLSQSNDFFIYLSALFVNGKSTKNLLRQTQFSFPTKSGTCNYQLTSSKTFSSLGNDLSQRESTIVHLHTRDSSSEISPVTNTSSHPHRVVSRQPYPPDVLPRSKPAIDKQFRLACSSVVTCTNKLPPSRCDTPAYNRGCETPSSSSRKPYKQRSRCNHPKVHAPAVRHVVEDGSCTSLV